MIRLFRVFVPVGVVALLVSELVLITSCLIVATYLVLPVDPTVYLFYDGGLTKVLLVVASMLLGMHLQDLYSHIQVKSRIALAQQLCFVLGIAFVAQGLISYFSQSLRVPLRVMLGGGTLSICALFIWRNIYVRYVLGVVGFQRILFVGAGPVVEEIVCHIEQHPEMGLAVAGYVDDNDVSGASPHAGKLLGPVHSVYEVATKFKPNRIVVGLSERRGQMPVHDLLELRFAGFVIEEAATAYETVCSRISTRELRPSQLIFSGELGPRPNTVLVQSLFNYSFAFVCTVLLLPLMIITAFAVKLSSAGPALYRQTRVGLDGEPFVLYKFRSMDVNAEAATGAVWASKDDPRITRVGRVLRKLRLDELPQLLNVLKGEMSIVGPRPERPEFVKVLSEQIPYYRQRHCVKPGITGWAQINHKYGDTVEDTIRKLEYDLYYIKNMSSSLDTYIIFHTLKTMLLSRGSQ